MLQTRNIIEKIGAYTRATQGLIGKTEEYLAFIKKEVPFEFWREFGLAYFGDNQFGNWEINIDGKPIPDYTGSFKRKFYYGNNFNYDYTYCTGAELVAWAKGLKDLTDKAVKLIESLTASAEAVLQTDNN